MRYITFIFYLVIIPNIIFSQNDSEFSTFTDSRDGKAYKTVKIGNQTWMAENLAYIAGNNCLDTDFDFNKEEYGQLYSWETAKKVCPTNWYLPSKEEYETLLDKYGGEKNYTNENYEALIPGGISGFSALFGGWRNINGDSGYFGRSGYFWMSSQNGNKSWGLNIASGFKKAGFISYNKIIGMSVRCVQDN